MKPTFLRHTSRLRARAISVHAASAPAKTVRLPVKRVDPEAFKPFGQVISATPDGKGFDDKDAQLQLNKGQPRFYVMRIPSRGLTFDRITYHDEVTQCLGGLAAEPWYLAVAAPTGSVDRHPTEADLHAFEVPHGSFVKLHAGTWHAGPLFSEPAQMDFYNLELADTNVVDHNTHVYTESDGIRFELHAS